MAGSEPLYADCIFRTWILCANVCWEIGHRHRFLFGYLIPVQGIEAILSQGRFGVNFNDDYAGNDLR